MQKFFLLILSALLPLPATATGMIVRTTCAPVIDSEGHPTLRFKQISTSAPGGPVSTRTTVRVDGSREYESLAEGVFEEGLRLRTRSLRTPSGAYSVKLQWVDLEPGQTGLEPLAEVLYLCE